jgi:hypothetical protein
MAIQSTSVFASPLQRQPLEDEPEVPPHVHWRAPQGAPDPATNQATNGAPGGPATNTEQGGAHEDASGQAEETTQTSLLDRLPPPLSREPAAYLPFMGRAAWNARRPATALDDLFEPEVRAQTPTAAAVAAATAPLPTAPTAPTAPSAPAPSPAPAPSTPQAPAANPSAGYVGERPVQAQWLQDREAALQNIRADYEAQRAQAQAQAPAFGANAPGWVDATLVTDESGQTRSASGAATVFVAEPGAQAAVVGYDESGPVYGSAPGRTLEFNEQAFAAHYQAQGGAPLQALADLYDTDAATLLGQQPQLWPLATQDHALNAGPPPPGHAMGDPQQLGMLDLYMADPQIQGLINSYGGSVAPATSAIAQEQVRLYGQARYEQMTRLSQAMQAVRDTYSAAMAQAESSGSGVGWVERQRTVTVSDESGPTRTEALFLTDESGARTPAMERVFDPDTFTRWYTAQDGQANRAFADFYGQSHTQYSTDESGVSRASSITFDNANWTMYGVGGGMSHRELVSLDPNNAPRLNNDSAVGFDLEAGWATSQSNIHQDRDWFETVLQVAAVAVVSYFTAGAASGWAAAAGWGATGTAVIAGAAAGAAGSLVSGAMNGNLAFKDILRGALAGGLSGGLLAEFGGTVANNFGPAGTVALRTTVQGGIQALLGGSFKDGALAGFASGLADLTSSGMNANIDKALEAGTMDAAQAMAARSFVRVLGSAVRAAGNPNDPASGFASSFLSDVLQQADPAGFNTRPGVPPAFDDEGNLMPGVVDPQASPQEQAAQLADHLQRQGLDADEAAALAQQTILEPWAQTRTQMLAVLNDPRTAQGRLVTSEEHDEVLAEVNRELGISADGDAVMRPVGLMDDAANYVGRLVSRAGGQLQTTLGKVMDAITIGRLEEAKQSISNYLDAAAARGGLSEIEIMALGVVYAANETLFPTTVLDLIPGAGKAIGKVGDLLRAGGRAGEVASVTRLESRAMAETERLTQLRITEVQSRAAREGREVVVQPRGTTGEWNAALNGPLKPNAVYVLDNGHSYFTDGVGRVTRAEGVLDLQKVDRNTYQQVLAGRIGGEGYDGGHLLATLFGGAGEKINLIPQLTEVNRGAFRSMEGQWAEAIRAGKSVRVEVNPVYSGTSKVPGSIDVTYWIDGKPTSRLFTNTPGG